jgi:hypothetical protein
MGLCWLPVPAGPPYMSPADTVEWLKRTHREPLAADCFKYNPDTGAYLLRFSVRYRMFDKWRLFSIWADSWEQAERGLEEMMRTAEVVAQEIQKGAGSP